MIVSEAQKYVYQNLQHKCMDAKLMRIVAFIRQTFDYLFAVDIEQAC